jgi:hypothetical protein
MKIAIARWSATPAQNNQRLGRPRNAQPNPTASSTAITGYVAAATTNAFVSSACAIPCSGAATPKRGLRSQ